MTTVSVIMPVYNAERFVAEAIDSILAQTLPDWELIIIDDGSSDSTPAILGHYHDSRICITRQENQGAAAARNLGLDRARGKYIAFLDADDVYLDTALADMVEFLDHHIDFDIVYSDGYFCNRGGRPLTRISEHRPGLFTGDILEWVVMSSSMILAVNTTLTRRSFIEDSGLRFEVDLRTSEDSYFWIQAARRARFGYLDKVTCMYRLHGTNTSITTSDAKRREMRLLTRLKMMNSNWFDDLSPETRLHFFYQLLVAILYDQPRRQSEVFASSQFLDLSAIQKAYLYRMVANGHLLRRRELRFAESCLKQSLALNPHDGKSEVLLKLLRMNPFLCFLGLKTWQQVSQFRLSLKTIGQTKPKPVPEVLRNSSLS